jgi:hypothetical protein
MWKQDYSPVNKVGLSQRMSALQPIFSPDGKPKCKEETLNRTTSHCSLGQPILYVTARSRRPFCCWLRFP